MSISSTKHNNKKRRKEKNTILFYVETFRIIDTLAVYGWVAYYYHYYLHHCITGCTV
uniref:Uncharacterized protein n=1 Tax=Anopheles minimus TaxID=112268 RepID=A0A182WP69_9DIPT